MDWVTGRGADDAAGGARTATWSGGVCEIGPVVLRLDRPVASSKAQRLSNATHKAVLRARSVAPRISQAARRRRLQLLSRRASSAGGRRDGVGGAEGFFSGLKCSPAFRAVVVFVVVAFLRHVKPGFEILRAPCLEALDSGARLLARLLETSSPISFASRGTNELHAPVLQHVALQETSVLTREEIVASSDGVVVPMTPLTSPLLLELRAAVDVLNPYETWACVLRHGFALRR